MTALPDEGPRLPENDEEWQQAVNAAKGLLALHSSYVYGLVTGGPVVDAERCDFVLEEGHKRGFMPSPTAIEDVLRELL